MYPYRSDSVQSALEHMPSGPYASNDAPHNHTQRYTLDPGFEQRDLEDKKAIDAQGVQDNLHWYNFTKEQDLINRR